MVITKIVLGAGQIQSQQELLPETMNPMLMRRAEEVLALLRAGTPSVDNPIPNGPEMTVSLGVTRDEHSEKRARERWQERNPEADLAQYEVVREQRELERQRTEFHVTYRGVTKNYKLLTPDTSIYDGGLAGVVIGTFLRDVPRVKESEEDRSTRNKQFDAVVRQCVALKPGFIAPSALMDDRSSFTDYFAVTMLLSDEVPPE